MYNMKEVLQLVTSEQLRKYSVSAAQLLDHENEDILINRIIQSKW